MRLVDGERRLSARWTLITCAYRDKSDTFQIRGSRASPRWASLVSYRNDSTIAGHHRAVSRCYPLFSSFSLCSHPCYLNCTRKKVHTYTPRSTIVTHVAFKSAAAACCTGCVQKTQRLNERSLLLVYSLVGLR